MSYNGTVYCSYCGEKGHNKRGCPVRKDYIANNPDSWSAKREAEFQRMRQSRLRVRRCSYCQASGHNRRTCPTKKKDRQRLVEYLKKERAGVFFKIKELGWGVGALYNRAGRWGDVPQAYMIHKIDWESIVNCEHYHFQSLSIANAVDAVSNDYHYPRLWNGVFALTEGTTEKLLLHRSDKVNPPPAWLNGTLYQEEEWFPAGHGRQNWVYNLLDKE